MQWAAEHLVGQSRYVFARRMVTRPAHPGADHDEVSEAQFRELEHSAKLAWHWIAHGFHYGIDATYARLVERGAVVIVNGSREHVQTIKGPHQVRVVHITADTHQVAERLLQRGREDAHAVASRLARNATFSEVGDHFRIENKGAVDQAGAQLVKYLYSL